MLNEPLIKPSHVGSLHKALGVPQGQKIPYNKVIEAEHSKNAALRKKAIFAETASHWHHGK